MDKQELRAAFSNLKIWKRREERAPHKPLLVLYSLGRVQRQEERMVLYTEVKETLKNLIEDFGPPRMSKPMYPFIYLSNDGIWELEGEGEIHTKGHYSEGELKEKNVRGGFPEQIYKILLHDPKLLTDIAQDLLEQHFPETLHEDILSMAGLQLQFGSQVKRNPQFRSRILQAYEYSCAVCGFSVWLSQLPVSLEAAHIKWHQAGGPDSEKNGIALCTLHHKLFDRGVFTLTHSLHIQVSEAAHGKVGFDEWLMRYHGGNLRLPIRPQYEPNNVYINWHNEEVFKKPGRCM